MRRILFVTVLLIPLLVGVEAHCEREMTRPTKGYLVIEDAGSQVIIAGKKLTPPVRVQARGGDGVWYDFPHDRTS